MRDKQVSCGWTSKDEIPSRLPRDLELVSWTVILGETVGWKRVVGDDFHWSLVDKGNSATTNGTTTEKLQIVKDCF
jgi:hypothetical protein